MRNLSLTLILLFIFAITSFAQAETDLNEGIELYRRGEYDKAIEILQNSLQVDEKDRVAWVYLGASFVKTGKDDEAVKTFRKVNGNYTKHKPVYEKDLKIISRPRPKYPESAKKNLVTGQIVLAVEFGSNGKIGFAFPFWTLPDGLTEEVIEAAKKIKFNPAVINGKPITVIRIVHYDFWI